VLTKTYFKTICGFVILGYLAVIATPAIAANGAMLELIDILQKKGTLTKDEADLLRSTANADEVNTEDQAEIKTAAKSLPKIETKDKITFESANGDFKWQPIGRVMADYIATDSDKTRLQSGFELRRARLGFEAQLWKKWIGKLEADFADNEVDIKDAFAGYKDTTAGGTAWWVKAGQSHFPSGFSTLSSSKYMTFMNRPIYADGEIQLARLMGLAAFVGQERWTAHAGIFGRPVGDTNEDCAEGTECDDPFYAGLRVTGVPFMQDATHLWHIGGSVQYRNPNGNTIDIDQHDAVIHVVANKNLNADFTGFADNAFGWGLETAAVWGPAHMKAEYVTLDVDLEPAGAAAIGQSSTDLDAWSVDVGYFLTGEFKNYEAKNAQWGSIKPKGIVGKGGVGAWEVGLRYEEADYNDGTDINGEMHLFTVGLNWYVNNTMRLMANYVTTLDYKEPGNAKDGDEPSAFMVRGQIYW
jgi:phosphate-selective porin OprO and OprP